MTNLKIMEKLDRASCLREQGTAQLHHSPCTGTRAPFKVGPAVCELRAADKEQLYHQLLLQAGLGLFEPRHLGRLGLG